MQDIREAERYILSHGKQKCKENQDSFYNYFSTKNNLLHSHSDKFIYFLFFIFLLKIPEHVDWFGWSTRDAFYTGVCLQRIEDGLKRYSYIE